jgi:hypothetical protein
VAELYATCCTFAEAALDAFVWLTIVMGFLWRASELGMADPCPTYCTIVQKVGVLTFRTNMHTDL